MQIVEDIIRQYHQDVSNALQEKRFSDVPVLEKACLECLSPENLLSTEVQRELDDMPTRILFSWLNDGCRGLSKAEVLTLAQNYFVDDKDWLERFRRFRVLGTAIVINVLTWQCEMRCSYCSIPKQSGREMDKDILDLSAELLLSAPQTKLEMRYFGGEPLLEWEKLQYSVETMWNRQQSSERCNEKELSFLITTNGMKLDEEKCKWLAQYPVSLQLALDGLPEAQNRYRVLHQSEEASYDNCAIAKAELLKQYKIPHTVIIVIHPARIEHMLEDFQHIVENGFEIIQINWAHNTIWHTHQIELFAQGLFRLSAFLRTRWEQGKGPKLLNLKEVLKKVRVPREVMVDWDGQIYGNNAYLFRPHIREELLIGNIREGRNWLHYNIDHSTEVDLDALSLAEKVFDNNAQVGTVFNSWIRWMAKGGLPDVDSFLETTYKK